ncbi:MAG: hypothetical protein WDW36_008549 [Sanguina aurantia]
MPGQGLGGAAPYIRFGVPLESLAQDTLEAGGTAVRAARAGAAARDEAAAAGQLLPAASNAQRRAAKAVGATAAAAAAPIAQAEAATTGRPFAAAGDAQLGVQPDGTAQTPTAADTAASAYLLHLLARHRRDPYIVQLRRRRLPSPGVEANGSAVATHAAPPAPTAAAAAAAGGDATQGGDDSPPGQGGGSEAAQRRTHVVEVALQHWATPALRLRAYVHALHLWLAAAGAPTPGGTTSTGGGSGGGCSDALSGGRGSKPGGGGGGGGRAAAAAAAAAGTAGAGIGRGAGMGGVVCGGAGVKGDASGGRKRVGTQPGSSPMDVNEGAAGRVRRAAGCGVSGVAAASEAWMAESCDGFLEAMAAAGWQVDRLLLPPPQWTSSWGEGLHED